MARKILIVDSSATMRRIIGGIIQANVNDAELAEASDAKEAWKKLGEEGFHLMLFSWEPSGDDWLAFFKRLREKHAVEQAAALLLTSDANRPYVQKALDAGAAEYLLIPFTPAELTGTMTRACNPVTLRHSNRYSLPDTTAVLRQEQKIFEASVINISDGGLLCAFDYDEDYRWMAPVMIDITFRIEGEEITATDLFSLPGRFSIVETNPDFTPRKIKMACRFNKVPPAAKKVLEMAFSMAEVQEKLLHTENE